MARKNLFTNLMKDDPSESDAIEPSPAATRFGASKSLSSSIDALARQAAKVSEGDIVVDLDPSLLDQSFVADRMTSNLGEDEQEYIELRDAIRERGQDSPILVRPSPTAPGRYMIVFGHRRARVARELNRSVKAVVKQIDDTAHVVSQGQENSARANLSFIERVCFADRLEALGHTRETIQAALSVDYQTLSKMLTIPSAFGPKIISAIGSARGVGRDRWLQLRKLVEVPRNREIAEELVSGSEFNATAAEGRFDFLFDNLKPGGRKRAVKKSENTSPRKVWTTTDSAVSVSKKSSGTSTTLVLSASKGLAFGSWITTNLDRLYEAFQSDQPKNGD